MNTEPIPSPSPNPKPDPNRQVVIGVAVILGICLVCCVTVGIGAVLAAPVLQEWASSQAGTPLKVDTPAPDFELADLHGETVRLSQFQGQPVLLVFGATRCPPCRAEAPLIQELHENHPEMTVLLVDMKESASTVQQYVNQMGLTHRVLLNAVWGGESVQQPEYLRVFVNQLRKKIEPGDEPKYILTEPWVGYRFVDEMAD